MNQVHAQQERLKESIEVRPAAGAWLIGNEDEFGDALAAMIQEQGRTYRDIEMSCLMGNGYVAKMVAAHRHGSDRKRWTRKAFNITENVFYALAELGRSIVIMPTDEALARIEQTGTLRGPRPKPRGRKGEQLELKFGPLPPRKRGMAWAHLIDEERKIREMMAA